MIKRSDDLAIAIHGKIIQGNDAGASRLVKEYAVSILEEAKEAVRGILPNARLVDDACEEINKIWASL